MRSKKKDARPGRILAGFAKPHSITANYLRPRRVLHWRRAIVLFEIRIVPIHMFALDPGSLLRQNRPIEFLQQPAD
jgi:hypothetical protein